MSTGIASLLLDQTNHVISRTTPYVEIEGQNYSTNLQLGPKVTFIPPLVNATGTHTPGCENLDNAKHLLLQVSNMCCAAAFLVPHKFQFGILGMRCLLTISFLLGSIWAGIVTCAPDILTWNIVLFFINLGHCGYLVYKHCPPRIEPELLDLYMKVFFPVKVQKKHFKELVRDAEIQTLDEDEHYAMEGITEADQRLSILLSGRMKATCEEVLLHYIMPTEFVDSPEWESCRKDSDKLFQVTLTALERCRLLTWRRQSLQVLLKGNRFLDMVLYNLVGKDITHKLYSLNDHHKADDVKSTIVPSHPEMWRTQMSKSVSVDAVHTGTKGKVRSIMWRENERRESAAHSESIAGSPLGTPKHCLHYSDPGPAESLAKPFMKPGETSSVKAK